MLRYQSSSLEAAVQPCRPNSHDGDFASRQRHVSSIQTVDDFPPDRHSPNNSRSVVSVTLLWVASTSPVAHEGGRNEEVESVVSLLGTTICDGLVRYHTVNL